MSGKFISAALAIALTASALTAGATVANAGDYRGGYRHHHNHHRGGGDGLALALGLGLGALVLSEALSPPAVYVRPAPIYSPVPPPPPGELAAIPGTRRDLPGYVAYQARDYYGVIFQCRQYDNGYRYCN